MRKLNFIFSLLVLPSFISAVFCVTASQAATTSGVMLVDEIWSGTINITGDVTVPSDITLTIEPGTEVIFSAQSDDTSGGQDISRSELIINGSLIAEGTSLSPILFTSNASIEGKGDWSGIYTSWGLGLKALRMDFCKIEYAVSGLKYTANKGVHSISVKNSNIRDTSGTGLSISAEGGSKVSLALSGNEISDNDGYGIDCSAVDSGTELGGSIVDNEITGSGNNGLYVYTYNSGKSDLTISENRIHGNRDYGIYLYNSMTDDVISNFAVTGNTVYGNDTASGSGVGIYTSAYRGKMTVEIVDNEVYQSSEGIYCRSANNITNSNYRYQGVIWAQIRGNDVHDNSSRGIYCYAGYYHSRIYPQITGNRVYRNGTDGIQLDYLSSYSHVLAPVITLNEVYDNGGRGIYCRPTITIKALFNNIYNNSGHEIYNDSSFAIDARHTYWGDSVKAEMDSVGSHGNISKIFDIHDNSSKGLVDYQNWSSTKNDISQNLVSKISDPHQGAELGEGELLIEGIAFAKDGIEKVSISLDGGATWFNAVGTATWSYTASEIYDGNYTIVSRVIDKLGIIETQGDEITITIDKDQITRAGTLNDNEIWSGDVALSGDVVVPEGLTLTILPGTRLNIPALFDSTYGGSNTSKSELTIAGSLIAEGTAENPIIFTSDRTVGAKGDWGGIRVNGSLRLRHAVVEYADFGVKSTANDSAQELLIADCIIRDTAGDGINIYADSSAEISAIIENNSIGNNTGRGINLRSYTGSTLIDATICGNTITENGDIGIYIYADGGSGNPSVIGLICDNTIDGHSTYGIHANTYQGAVSDLAIEYNDIISSGIGIYAYNNSAAASSVLDIYRNTVSVGTEGIKVYVNYSSLSPIIRGNEVYNHASNGLHCSYGTLNSHQFLPIIEENQVYNNAAYGIYLKATGETRLANNSLYDNSSYDLYNDSAFDIDAMGNWWGTDTTNEMNDLGYPADISAIFDYYDDGSKGTLNYSSWLMLYDEPNPPTLDPVTSPTRGEVGDPTPIPVTGLMAYYPFNGNADDESGNNRDGIPHGVTHTEDRFGNANSAYHFDGIDDYINITSDAVLNPSDQLTLAFWIRIDGFTNTWSPVIHKGGQQTGGLTNREYTVWLNNQATFHLASAGDGTTQLVYNSTTQTTGQWLFFAGVLDRKNHLARIYIDDKLDMSASDAYSSFNNNDSDLRFGWTEETDGSYSPLKGVLDDVRFYNRALSEVEIHNLFIENVPRIVQILSGTKDAGTSIVLNGKEVAPVDEQTTWSYELSLSEGSNPITIYSRNSDGMASEAIDSEIVLDTTAPFIHSSVPANESHVKRSVDSIDITLIEESTQIDTAATLAGAIVEEDSGTVISGQWNIVYNHAVFTPGSPMGVGDYTVTLTPTDAPLGNSETSSITFTVDLTAPGIPTLNAVTSPANATPQTISGTKDPDTSIWLNNSQIIPSDDLATWSYNLALDEGENTHNLFARDQAGNRSEEAIFTIILDRAPPELESSVPANASFIKDAPTQISLYFTDVTTSLAEGPTLANAAFRNSANQDLAGTWALVPENIVTFTPTATLVEDTYTASLQAHDLAGNTLPVNLAFTYDITPPAAPTLNPVASPTIFSVQTLTGTKADDASIWINGLEVIPVNSSADWSYQISLIEGDNPLEIYSKDAAGNQSDAIHAVIVYDETAPLPVTTLTADGRGIGTEVQLDWSGYDEQIQGDIDLYRVYAEDHLFTQVGGLQAVGTVPAGTFNYSAGDLVKGVLYYFAVVAVDNKGNALSSVTPVSAVPTDTVPPEDVINLQVQCSESSLTFTWNHSENSYGDLAGYRVYFDGATDGIDVDMLQNTFEQTGLSAGTSYEFRITAIDTGGNESPGAEIVGVTLLPNPLNITLTPYSGYVDIAWDGVEPAQLVKHYAIYVSAADFDSVARMTPAVTTPAVSAKVAGLTNLQTYYFAVTTINLSECENQQVDTVTETPVPDSQGPEIKDVELNGSPLGNGAVLGSASIVSLNAVDPAGVSRVEFLVSGQLYLTDTNPADGYTFPWDIAAEIDGEYTLTIMAYDTLGNSSSVVYSLNVVLQPPSTPVITQPADGTLVNTTEVTVAGQAEKHTEILLFNNDVQIGTWQAADAAGRFSLPVNLEEGVNRVQAQARNRADSSPLSTEVLVTLDTSIPDSPGHLSAQSKPGGAVRLEWSSPLGISVKGYNLYRATAEFSSPPEAQQINTGLITATSYSDLPADDSIYFYRVSTVSLADNESALSNESSALSDREFPRAVAIQYTPDGPFDPATGRTAPGRVDVVLTVSEPLLVAPFLSINPLGAVPLSVDLVRESETTYTGFFIISDDTPSGTAYAVFSGRDQAGNRGTDIGTGNTILIDTDGPAVTAIEIQPASPIRNDQSNPVNVQVTIGLNEKVKSGEEAVLSYLLSGSGRSLVPIDGLSRITPQSGQLETWRGTFQMPDNAGLAEAESFQFIYQGVDDLDNVSDRIQCANNFQVYQGSLPPLESPANLRGQALPAGRIKLSWDTVDGAVGYILYRQAPSDSDLAEYLRLDAETEYIDDPGEDGIYLYAVASIRFENAEEAISGMSDTATVVSDSAAPATPLNLVLELVAQGVKASWEAGDVTESVKYSLYRSAQDPILSVEGLDPILTGLNDAIVIDSKPSPDEHTYAVTATDSAGNESGPSNSVYLNFQLLPVSSITVQQEDNDLPLVSWSHAGGGIAGYNFYLDSIKLNEELLSKLNYTDAGYAGDERHYAVSAVDGSNHESLKRNITLPVLSATLADGEALQRGLMNQLAYRVENISAARVDNIHLKVRCGGYDHISAPFGIDSGTSQMVLVAIGGYSDLPDLADLRTSIEVTPNAGEKVEIVRNSQIAVSDGTLVADILNEEFVRGGQGKVQFRLENTGEAEIEIVTATASGSSASDEIAFYLLDQDGNVLSTKAFKQNIGQGVVTLANGVSVARVPAGGIFTSAPVDIELPAAMPDEVVLVLDIQRIYHHLGRSDQVTMDGLRTSRELSLIDTTYYGELIGIAPEMSNGDEDIIIRGRAVERASGTQLAEVPLKLFVSVKGFERRYDVFTDENGEFEFVFTPLPDESGIYNVRAIHPDIFDKPVQGQFVINRLNFDPKTVNLNIPKNYEQTFNIRATAGDGAVLNNLQLVYAELDQPSGFFSQGVHVGLDPPVAVLSDKQSVNLKCTIWADNTADEVGKIVVKVKSDESGSEGWGSVVINTHFTDAQPVLYYAPDHVETGMALDDSISEILVLENRGQTAMEDVSLSIVNEDGSPAPAWMLLNSAPDQGAIAVGEKREVGLSFSPTAETASEGVYTCYLRVTSSNHLKRDIPLFVWVTQSGIGSALFKVEDIYTGTTDESAGEVIQGLAGAKIRVKNEEVTTVEQTLTTDSVGEALFADLPAGRYKYRVTAANHQEQIGRIWVKPGITASEKVFLGYNLVTVSWEVTEKTIEDRYEIVLNATFETDVPAAVVVAEPASITLPDMKAGDVFHGEFTLTNYGFIRADHLNTVLPPDDANFKYELLDALPDSLEAKGVITVPYRVTCIKALSQEEETQSGGGCRRYLRCIRTYYSYVCSNGDRYSSSTRFCYLTDNGQCGGSSPGGGGGLYINWGPSGGGWSPSPSDDDLDGVVCWPVNARQEIQDYSLDWISDVLYYVGCSVNCLLREYNDEALDLTVKVPGGSIAVKRLFYANDWHWEHTRNNLVINYYTDRQIPAEIDSGVMHEYVDSIEKGGVVYRKESKYSKYYSNSTNKIFFKPGLALWEDKFGNWMKFDLEGRLTTYGNRWGATGKLIREEGAEDKPNGISDRNDVQVIWFEYDNDGRLARVSDSEDRSVEYFYTADKLTKVIDVLGNETVYEYDGEGRIVRTVDAGGRPTLASYDQYGHVETVVDRNGTGHFFKYNFDEVKKQLYAQIKTSSGMVKEVWFNDEGETERVDVNGRTTKKQVKDGRTLLVIDEKGNTTKKQYDEWNNLIEIDYPDGTTASFEYDSRFHRPSRIVDQRGNATTHEFDESGNLTRKNEATGTADERASTFIYDEFGQLLNATVIGDENTAPASSIFSYDNNGNIESITDPEGNTIHFLEHDNMGNMLRMEDPRGSIWFFEYDAMGRLTSQTDPQSNIVQYEYDGANNRTAIVNAYLKRHDFEYDDHNNLIKEIDPYSNFSTYEYNTDNLLSRSVDKEGRSSRTEYDNEGRVIRRVDGAGNVITYQYDETDQTFATSEKPVLIEFPTYSRRLYYDRMQRVIREVDILDDSTTYSKSYEYDEAGNLISQTDAENNTTLFEYDSLNRLIKITDAKGGVTGRSFDDRGNLIEIIDPNNGLTRYEYDGNDRLTKIVRPMGEETVFDYDAGGNRTSVLDTKGQKIEYIYDELGQMVRADYFTADDHANAVKNVDFEYDKLGSLIGYEDGVTSAVYEYDDLQRKISETVDYGSFSLSYLYTYYANGLKKSFTGPDGITYNFTYDENNRLRGIDIPAIGPVTYNTYHWNSLSKFTLPGRSSTEYDYDPLMRLKSIHARDPAQNTLVQRSHTYSPVGNILEKNTEHGNYLYQYDELYRLTNAANPTLEDEAYSYDQLNNRLTAQGVNGQWIYNLNNQLLSYGDVSFAYDANGNMTQRADGSSTKNSIYNVEDRLARVEDGNSNLIAEYYYDPFGRRLWKEAGGVRTYFLYSDEGLVGEYDATGNELKTYGYTPDSLWSTNPLFQKISGNYYFYQNDHLGTPQKIADISGRVVWSAQYHSFGNPTGTYHTQINPDFNHLGFPGQYYDAETGLYYNWNRYYDPTTGRYISVDPLRQGLNHYVYSFGNPIGYIDPEGLCTLRIVGGASEIVAGILLIPGTGGLGTAAAIVIIANGLDNLVAGTRSAIGGPEGYQQAILERTIYNYVPNETAAGFIYAGTQILIPYGGMKFAQYDKARLAAQTINNPIPDRMARVIAGEGPYPTLGQPGAQDVFVTAADDISGMNASQISRRLTIDPSAKYTVIEFDAPTSGIASPINRTNKGFVGKGLTGGGAREYVIPNQTIPSGSTIRIVE